MSSNVPPFGGHSKRCRSSASTDGLSDALVEQFVKRTPVDQSKPERLKTPDL